LKDSELGGIGNAFNDDHNDGGLLRCQILMLMITACRCIKEYKSLVLCVGFSFENAVDGQLGEF